MHHYQEWKMYIGAFLLCFIFSAFVIFIFLDYKKIYTYKDEEQGKNMMIHLLISGVLFLLFFIVYNIIKGLIVQP